MGRGMGPQPAELAFGAAAWRTTAAGGGCSPGSLPGLALVQVAYVFPTLPAIRPNIVLNEPREVGRKGRVELSAVNPAGQVLYHP
jgi:hypothetical protein